MAIKRVTMQDIADACNLSRNTISKVFNGRGTVPEATRHMVLQKAQELGYFQIPNEDISRAQTHSQNIALITSQMPVDYHFGTLLIPAFTERLSRFGYTLMMYEITEEELRQNNLPAHMLLDQTAGILGIEVFDKDYLDMLCSLKLPFISIDSCIGASTSLMNCDLIFMENMASTFSLTSHMISAGARNLGFIGDANHCSSFQERWQGFCSALDSAGLTLDKRLCILSGDISPYSDAEWLMEQINQMPSIPDAFVCANDYLAIHLITALKQYGIVIPRDVMVAGFDDTPQSAFIEPSLTTAQIPSTYIGRLAADMLLDRIENPNQPFRSIYVKTTPLLRNSTLRQG